MHICTISYCTDNCMHELLSDDNRYLEVGTSNMLRSTHGKMPGLPQMSLYSNSQSMQNGKRHLTFPSITSDRRYPKGLISLP